MQVIRLLIVGIGLVMILGAGGAYGLRHLQVDLPFAGLLPDAAGDEGAVDAAQPRRPDLPASYTALERNDLRPPLPVDVSYSPVVRDVTSYRMVEGLATVRRASIYDGGTGTEPRPVVVLLHGANRDELSMIDMWDDTADAHGLLLVSLKSDGARWDPNNDDSGLIARALDLAAEDYPIDRERVFMFGHSSGSIYAQLLANRYDGPWVAVAGHAGFVPEGWLIPQDNAPAIRHYLGSFDRLFPLADARQSGQALADMGHFTELVVIQGHTHWFYEGGPQIAEDAWLWFADLVAEPAG